MKISGLISGAVSLWTGSRDGLMVWEELLIMENVRLPGGTYVDSDGQWYIIP